MFFDVGGSMDLYICVVEELFSVVCSEFKYLEYYYFYNCIYEGFWCDNVCCWCEQIFMWDVLCIYGFDYKCIIVGDVLMFFYEIMYKGGVNEYWNKEVGYMWFEWVWEQWLDYIWLNLML